MKHECAKSGLELTEIRHPIYRCGCGVVIRLKRITRHEAVEVKDKCTSLMEYGVADGDVAIRCELGRGHEGSHKNSVVNVEWTQS